MLTLSTTGYTDTRYFDCARFSPLRIALVAAAHLGVFALLFTTQYLPTRTASPAVMVQWLPHAHRPAPAPTPPPSPAAQPPRTIEKPAQITAAKPQLPAKTRKVESTPAEASRPAATNPPESNALPPAPATPASASLNRPATEAPAPLVSEPRFDADYLSNPAPAYPALSRRLGEQGKVILRVFVESAGRPGQIELKTSSGSPRLDHAAQEAIRHWKFIPAYRGQEAIGAWVLVPIVFNLKG